MKCERCNEDIRDDKYKVKIKNGFATGGFIFAALCDDCENTANSHTIRRNDQAIDLCRAARDEEVKELREALLELWHVTGCEDDWEFNKENPGRLTPNYVRIMERCQRALAKHESKERP